MEVQRKILPELIAKDNIAFGPSKMRYVAYFVSVVALLAADADLSPGWSYQGEGLQRVCRPKLTPPRKIELGKEGIFTWTCGDGEQAGNGYYVVFIRPSGTYVLLKVPELRTSFVFTPDVAGTWRWIVINTDPDRTKPDVESEPSNFEVVQVQPREN